MPSKFAAELNYLVEELRLFIEKAADMDASGVNVRQCDRNWDAEQSSASLGQNSTGSGSEPGELDSEEKDPSRMVVESSDSDSNDDSEKPLNFNYENPGLDDIVPVPLVESSVMPIAYQKQFQDVFGYFRAIMAKGELSERARLICEDAATLNPANYSVWMYRRKILDHIKGDYHQELVYITKVVTRNPKNYQVW